MIHPSLGEVAEAIVQVAAALGVLSLAFRRVRSWIGEKWRKVIGRSVSREEVEQLRADIQTALSDHFAQFHAQLETLTKEITHALHSGMGKLSDRMELMESQIRINADRDEGVGIIECDEHGDFTFVSKSVCDWLDADREQLLGKRWLRFVDFDERSMIRAEIPQANADHREIRMEITMGPDGKPKQRYLFSLHPMPANPPLRAWAGYFRPLAI